jgi:hypothetical protein
MAKFIIEGTMELYFSNEIEADSLEEAEEILENGYGCIYYANNTFGISGPGTPVNVSGEDVTNTDIREDFEIQ